MVLIAWCANFYHDKQYFQYGISIDISSYSENARPTKPGVQSSNTSRVRFTVISRTAVHSRFYHTHIVYKRNEDGSCLMDLTQKRYP